MDSPDRFRSRLDARRAGLTDAQLRTRVGRGELRRVRRGVYSDSEAWNNLDEIERFRVRTAAALSCRAPIWVASHWSAAALHGLATLAPDHRLVHLSLDGRGGGSRGSEIVEHRVRLAAEDCTVLDGLRVTTAARTALDLACDLSSIKALCVVESALRTGCTDLAGALERMGGRRGIPSARRAVALADPATESIGESWSRALMMEWPEVPAPRLQHEFRDPLGRFVARTDFDWDGRLVGEFDGMVKYAADGSAAVVKEKHREDALRAMGVHVVRWTWDDLRSPSRLRRILAAGFDLARR